MHSFLVQEYPLRLDRKSKFSIDLFVASNKDYNASEKQNHNYNQNEVWDMK